MAFVSPIPMLARRARVAVTPRRPMHHSAHGRVRMTAAGQTETLEKAWPAFAERMKAADEVPPVEDWHYLLDIAVKAGDDPKLGIWLINLMHETGLKPTAVTYEKVLHLCALKKDRVAAFHLVEHMFQDKVLLGDVELPDGMEDVLRKILPPEAFE